MLHNHRPFLLKTLGDSCMLLQLEFFHILNPLYNFSHLNFNYFLTPYIYHIFITNTF